MSATTRRTFPLSQGSTLSAAEGSAHGAGGDSRRGIRDVAVLCGRATGGQTSHPHRIGRASPERHRLASPVTVAGCFWVHAPARATGACPAGIRAGPRGRTPGRTDALIRPPFAPESGSRKV
ncbi:MAG: hypothetical protein ABSH56_13380 [Bryobacteraceae bacterium]